MFSVAIRFVSVLLQLITHSLATIASKIEEKGTVLFRVQQVVKKTKNYEKNEGNAGHNCICETGI